MIAFVDTSVVLRKLFGEPEPLSDWSSISRGYVSRLLQTEAGRVIDRSRLAGHIDDADVVQLQQELRRLLRSFAIVAVTEPLLEQAGGPMPTLLGTLDALHLVSAMAVARQLDEPLHFATHDARLAAGARASGFEVMGI